MDLDHLDLRVHHPAACRAFYERWFDFTHAFDADGTEIEQHREG